MPFGQTRNFTVPAGPDCWAGRVVWSTIEPHCRDSTPLHFFFTPHWHGHQQRVIINARPRSGSVPLGAQQFGTNTSITVDSWFVKAFCMPNCVDHFGTNTSVTVGLGASAILVGGTGVVADGVCSISGRERGVDSMWSIQRQPVTGGNGTPPERIFPHRLPGG